MGKGRTAISSLIISIFSVLLHKIFFLGTVAALISLILGSDGMYKGEKYNIACAGWVISIIGASLSIITFLNNGKLIGL